MQYDLDVFSVGIGDLAHRPAACAQQLHHCRDIRLAGHSVVDLISHLHHSDIDSRVQDLCQALLGKIIKRIRFLIRRHAFPGFRSMLPFGICPEIRIVEINVYFHPILRGAFSEFDRGCDIIVSAAVTISVLIIRIVPDTQTDVIHAGFRQCLKHILLFSVVTVVLCAAFFD